VTLLKRYGFLLLGGMLMLGGLELLELHDISIISSAEAKVGRPITPVSVAGVARRTSRR
jgi:hypothetical protein